MNETNDFADFTEEDVAKSIKNLLSTDLNKIFQKMGMTFEKILREIDNNIDIDANEDETVIEYSKRCLKYIMINKLTKSIGKKIKNEETENSTHATVESDVMDKFLDDYVDAYTEGNVDKMTAIIAEYGILPVIEGDELSGIPMNETQKETCNKILRTYIKRFDKASQNISQENEKNDQDEKVSELEPQKEPKKILVTENDNENIQTANSEGTSDIKIAFASQEQTISESSGIVSQTETEEKEAVDVQKFLGIFTSNTVQDEKSKNAFSTVVSTITRDVISVENKEESLFPNELKQDDNDTIYR